MEEPKSEIQIAGNQNIPNYQHETKLTSRNCSESRGLKADIVGILVNKTKLQMQGTNGHQELPYLPRSYSLFKGGFNSIISDPQKITSSPSAFYCNRLNYNMCTGGRRRWKFLSPQIQVYSTSRNSLRMFFTLSLRFRPKPRVNHPGS